MIIWRITPTSMILRRLFQNNGSGHWNTNRRQHNTNSSHLSLEGLGEFKVTSNSLKESVSVPLVAISVPRNVLHQAPARIILQPAGMMNELPRQAEASFQPL